MTEKLNEKSSGLDDNAQAQSNNPLEELAKIIGYQDEVPSKASTDSPANDAAMDLEAELLREFGVSPSDDVVPTEQTPIEHAPVGQVNEPVQEPIAYTEVPNSVGDDVLDDMSRYALPNHGQAMQGPKSMFPEASLPETDVSLGFALAAVEPNNPDSIGAATPETSELIGSIDQQVEENLFVPPVMSRVTPVAPVELDVNRAHEIPAIPENIFESSQANPSADLQNNEVTDLPNPLNASAVPVDINDENSELGLEIPSVDMGKLSSDLELELAKLQDGMLSGVNEAPEYGHQIEPTATTDFASVQSPVSQQVPIENLPFPSIVLPRETVSNTQEIPAADQNGVSVQSDELESVLNVADFTETESDVEETAQFEIPDLPNVENFQTNSSSMDVDLDLELEREFSQLLSDDVDMAEEFQIAPIVENESSILASAAALHVRSELDEVKNTQVSEQDELNELFDVGVAEDVSHQMQSVDVSSIRPERIDVTNDAETVDNEAIAAAAGDGSRSNLFGVIGVLGAILLGGGAYLYYQNSNTGLGGSGEPIIIKADNTPIKQVPADPGGASVPNQDQAVYDQVEGNDVSVANQPSLVESTEEPVDIVQRTLNPSVLPLEGRETAGDNKNADRLAANQSNDGTEIASNNPQPLVTPRRVQTVIVQADGTIITREAPAPAAIETTPTANTAIATTEVSTIEVVPTPEVAITTPEVVVTTPIVTVKPEVTAPLSNDSAAAISNVPVTPAANFSGHYMQIASQPSLDAAQSTYANLSRRFSSILGGRGVEYQKAVIEGKGTFHRVRIQVGTRGEANSLCSRYKSAGGSCFVAR